jgi:hypothetical protein
LSRTAWKLRERQAAALINGHRYPANTGRGIDCEGPRCVAQVKERRSLSLAELTRLALDAEAEGVARDKAGVVIVKLSAGQGRATPFLVVATAAVWRRLFVGNTFVAEAAR